jgi:ABC-2 type transport system ATP-binding protein
MTAAIELVGVSKVFGRIRAVDGLAFSVPEGSLFGLIGPNGAGKTTTFGLLAGFLKPTSGEIRARGEPLRFGTPRVGKIVALPQDAQLPPRMTAVDALVMLGRLGGLDKETADRRSVAALERLGLTTPIAFQKIGTLSHGQRRRVAIAQTLLGDREVILLDEPTAGLDPLAAAELRQLIKELRKDRTIILSSHNLSEVEALCDRAAIIAAGKLVSIGTMDELRKATSLVRVVLASPPGDPAQATSLLRTIEGVRSATPAPDDPRAIDLEVADDGHGGADRVVNDVLKKIMELGASIRSVERGKSLEQSFLEVSRTAER